MTRSADDYRDVLGTRPDPEMERVVAALDRACARSAPLPSSARDAIDRTLHEQMVALARQGAAGERRPASRTVRRKVVVPIALLAALLIVGGAGAATFVNGMLPGVVLQHGVSVNLTSSACGYTVSIRQAYVDSLQLVIGYTVRAPAGRLLLQAGPDLDVAAAVVRNGRSQSLGMVLRDAIGVVGGAASGTLPVGRITSGALSFDAGSILDGASVRASPLRVRITIPSIGVAEHLTPGSPPLAACEAHPPLNPPPLSLRPKHTRLFSVPGPFVFNLSVPVYTAERVYHVARTLRAGDEDVTLERVLVTPTDTRVYLRRVAGEDGLNTRRPRLIVDDSALASFGHRLGGFHVHFEADPFWVSTARDTTWYFNNAPNPPGLVDYGVLGPPLFGYHGPWMLVVPTRSGRPVTFHFTVP